MMASLVSVHSLTAKLLQTFKSSSQAKTSPNLKTERFVKTLKSQARKSLKADS